MSFADETITYAVSVKGGEKIMQVYFENYDDFKETLKYGFIEMNGQRNLGSVFAYFLEDKGINICFKVSTEGQIPMSWNITGKELRVFVDSCKLSPTAALHRVIDMQIKIANLKLPMTTVETKHATTVAINSLMGDVTDESFLLQAIKHKGRDLLVEYKINDDAMKYAKYLNERQNDLDFMDTLVQGLVQDKDMLEFMGMLTITHSNIVLVYQGDTSKKIVTIRIPYTILRNHCKVPQELLSIN